MPVIARAALVLVIVVFGFFYLMIASGGASFIHECNTFLCGQLHQAIFAGIGTLALFVAAYRVYSRESAAKVAFFGTLPILVVHVVLVMSDPNESIFFPLSTAPPPVVSGASLLLRRLKR
ncbi:hypothetical protein BH20ACT23_BH20ACT23_26260 [soil metagenome]